MWLTAYGGRYLHPSLKPEAKTKAVVSLLYPQSLAQYQSQSRPQKIFLEEN